MACCRADCAASTSSCVAEPLASTPRAWVNAAAKGAQVSAVYCDSFRASARSMSAERALVSAAFGFTTVTWDVALCAVATEPFTVFDTTT